MKKYCNAVDGTFGDAIKDKTIKRDDIRQKTAKSWVYFEIFRSN